MYKRIPRPFRLECADKIGPSFRVALCGVHGRYRSWRGRMVTKVRIGIRVHRWVHLFCVVHIYRGRRGRPLQVVQRRVRASVLYGAILLSPDDKHNIPVTYRKHRS